MRFACLVTSVLVACLTLAAGPARAFTAVTPAGIPLAQPDALAIDDSGNIFVADRGRHLSDGALYEILAAGGYTGFVQIGSGFSVPQAVAVDGNGDLFVADLANNGEVCEISPAAMPAANGCASSNVVTLSTALGGPHGLALGGGGSIFVPDTIRGTVVEIPPGGGTPSPVATGFVFPQSVAVDGSGNVFVLDAGAFAGDPNAAIWEIPAGGGKIRLAGGFVFPQSIAVDGRETLYLADEGSPAVAGGIEKITGNGPMTLPGGSDHPNAVALDQRGNIYFIDGNLAPSFVDEMVGADALPVPALGLWALPLFALLLGGAGLAATRRRVSR
jgi:sugar lactone lactonase YvrE